MGERRGFLLRHARKYDGQVLRALMPGARLSQIKTQTPDGSRLIDKSRRKIGKREISSMPAAVCMQSATIWDARPRIHNSTWPRLSRYVPARKRAICIQMARSHRSGDVAIQLAPRIIAISLQLFRPDMYNVANMRTSKPPQTFLFHRNNKKCPPMIYMRG